MNGANEPLRPQAPKPVLYFAEHKFDGVEVGRVRHIVDVAEPQLSHRVLTLVRGVRCQVVHEDTDLVIAILLSQFHEVFLELIDVDRLLEEHVQFLASFPRDTCQHCVWRIIELSLIHPHIEIRQTVLSLGNRMLCEHGFVDVDDTVSVLSRLSQCSNHLGLVATIVAVALFPGLLFPLDPPPLDVVEFVHFREQGVVHLRHRELFQKMLHSLLE